jgi:hypothetical protein
VVQQQQQQEQEVRGHHSNERELYEKLAMMVGSNAHNRAAVTATCLVASCNSSCNEF